MTSLPVKKHLLGLKRIKNREESRLSYLRLDKNENIIGFDKDIIEVFKNQITSDFLTAYPEVASLYKKAAAFWAAKKKMFF